MKRKKLASMLWTVGAAALSETAAAATLDLTPTERDELAKVKL